MGNTVFTTVGEAHKFLDQSGFIPGPSDWTRKETSLVSLVKSIIKIDKTRAANIAIDARCDAIKLKGNGWMKQRSIPFGVNQIELWFRKILGGGEARSLGSEMSLVRGGGNLGDAIMYVTAVRGPVDERFEWKGLSPAFWRNKIGLPSKLNLNLSKGDFHVDSFNNDAVAGATLNAFGIKKKDGLEKLLTAMCDEILTAYKEGECRLKDLPSYMFRLGYRSKLKEAVKMKEKIDNLKPLGRAVAMCDALEQMLSSPVIRCFNSVMKDMASVPECYVKYRVNKTAKSWRDLGQRVRDAERVCEYDWKEFDWNRSREEIDFAVDILRSCFLPTSDHEQHVLDLAVESIRKAAVDLNYVIDDGTLLFLEDSLGSGISGTTIIGTIIHAMCAQRCADEVGGNGKVDFCCGGDDGLGLDGSGTFDWESWRDEMNLKCGANIVEEKFKIFIGDHLVHRNQLIMPEGFDFSQGTGKHIKEGRWETVDGVTDIDESRGRSHRFHYDCSNAPAFYGSHWRWDLMQIRPTQKSREKLLHPEGIIDSLDDYSSALLGLAIDNIFNESWLNQVKQRFLMCIQVSLASPQHFSHKEVLKMMAGANEPDGRLEIFPGIAEWRRGQSRIEFNENEAIKIFSKSFDDLMTLCQGIYIREEGGGIDQWRLTQVLQGRSAVPDDYWGSYLLDFNRKLKANGAMRQLGVKDPLKRQRAAMEPSATVQAQFKKYKTAYFKVLKDTTGTRKLELEKFVSEAIKKL